MDKLIQQKIKKHVEKEKRNAKDIFNRLALFIYSLEDSTSDLHLLAKFVPDQYLKPLIKHFDGGLIRVPSTQQFEDSLLLAVVYYLYGVKGMSWTAIREVMDYDTYFKGHNFISLGKKVQKIKTIINREMANQLKELDLAQAVSAILKEEVNLK
mgnify:CR=1 FL=1